MMKKLFVLLLGLCLLLQGALAAPAEMVKAPFGVLTEEMPNGDFSLTANGMKLTFTPIDIRFSLTRESSRYMFNNMGYFRHEELLGLMEEYDIYAMLYDRNQRTRVQVHLYEDPDAKSYTGMADWLVMTAEQAASISYGWTVKECEVVELEGLKLVRMLMSRLTEDGETEWRLLYKTREGGVEMEIQLLASGEKIIDMVEAQVDAFVRGIRVEKAE